MTVVGVGPATETERFAYPLGLGRRGRFLTLEGIEGSGKSTQISRLAARLTASGESVRATREPGGTALGRRIRSVLLDPGGRPPSPLAELLLYVADRVQHIAEVVEPALAQGIHVISDRYLDATIAYQGYGRGIELERIYALHRDPPLSLRPDRTILLDLDPVLGLERARSRNRESGTGATEGRFEDENLSFHRRVREGYLALAAAEPGRVRVVPADGSIDEVAERVADAVSDLFEGSRGDPQ